MKTKKNPLFDALGLKDGTKVETIHLPHNRRREIYTYEGRRTMELNFKDDELDGKYITYYDNEQKELEMDFEMGKQVGKERIWDRNGKYIDENIY